MFGRIVSCPVPSQPSRRAAVRVRNPFSCFQNLCWPDVASLWTVLFRELNECAYGLNILEGFTSSGYLDVTAAASLGCAFSYRCILHTLNLLKRPEALEVAEGALSKLFAGKVYDYLGFSSVSSAGCTCTVQKIARLFTHVSCQCAEFGAHLRCCLCGQCCAAHVALKDRVIKNASLMKVYPTFTTILSLVTTTRCVLTLFVLFCPKWVIHVSARLGMSVSKLLCLQEEFVFASHFERQSATPTFLGTSQNFTMATGTLTRVSNFLLGIRKRVKRLHFTSLLVMFRMHFITWVFPNGLRPFFFLLETVVSWRFRHDGEDR